ncbi:hypothetical protein ElyMa_005404500 [Elysia marginata]|uniref:Uncharacterized protein n=1 Tax=Elysia marginata TaxID=1093978 RepID=A0AAV4EH16_9GAST|nr:hypothetical protein ElyMa_005404500 [Elysia marginata]
MDGVEDALAEFVEQLRLRDAGNATPGLIPLVKPDNDVNVKDGSFGNLGTNCKEESIARSKVKKFLKNPFCLFKATD